MIKKFNHVGIAVKDLDKFIAFLEQTFGAKLMFRVRDGKGQFESAGITINDAQFEVLSSTSPGSMIDLHRLLFKTDKYKLQR
jgi:catechol 2,3-dioxygenase-like lactoylglutathione lyase family enzyme